jgi:cysteinyl-tRNA synthetase
MKKTFFFLIILTLISFQSCRKNNLPDLDFKQEMRDLVKGISEYGKGIHPGFIVIPQNGQELVSANGEGNGSPAIDYLTAIDGLGREDLFYGYDNDNEATPANERNYIIEYLDLAKDNGKEILAIDYCSSPSFMDNSYTQNESKGYISFAADHRELDNIPSYPSQPYQVNTNNITSLTEAQNFLYLINPVNFSTKQDLINAVTASNYDVLIMDLFFNDVEFTASEIIALKQKANGGSRLIICYMSIGEAEDYRYYWQSSWNNDKPAWLDDENPDWEGNYKVWYWEQDWKNVIYGNDSSYLKKILNAGFDGVYLDIIDAFEYYENQ